MKPHSQLCCSCQQPFYWQESAIAPALHWLSCLPCRRFIPVINNFALFTEEVQQPQELPAELLTLFQQNSSQYPHYLAQKKARHILEVYAALQPFNEATRVLFPLLTALQQTLKPGDIIIDSWDRSGWHGLLLSALFPQQRIVCIWDSNSSVLGYAGYDWWFSSAKKPANLDVMFLSADTPLPFATESVAFIFAHDVLHRYPFADYPNELERVCQQDGIIIYAHVHLSNSEPTPWFQRGGTLRSSEFYRHFFAEQLQGSHRAARVLSEAALFNLSAGYLEQAVDEQHYNGTIVIAAEAWLAQFFGTAHIQLTPDCRCLVNPLLVFEPFNRKISLNQQGLSAQAEYFLARHPCLQARIHLAVQQPLGFSEAELLLAVQSGDSLAEIAAKYAWPINAVLAQAKVLQQRELLLVLPVTPQALALQDFHTNDHRLCPPIFVQFWLDIAPCFSELSLTLEGEVLCYQEITQMMQALAAWLVAEKLHQHRKLHINAELTGGQRILLLLASWWLGLLPILETKPQQATEHGYLLNQNQHTCSLNQFWPVIEQYLGESVPPMNSAANFVSHNQQKIEWHQTILQWLKTEVS
jgi:hypothetical protein